MNQIKIIIIPAYFLILCLEVFGQVEKADIEIVVSGFQNKSGNVSLNLFQSGDGFPDQNEKSLASKKARISSDTIIFNFNDLPYGIYAVSVLHDENENGKMERNMLGMPKEGFAFSNNYKPSFSSPSFRDVKFVADRNKITLNLRMIYF